MSINKKDKEIFGISNFKPFRDLQEIDLAPITLVYGQNSGGKSSLLEALLCTNQSLEDNQIEQGVFNLSGKNFNSGTYASVINKFNKDDFMYLKFKPRFSQIPKKRSEFYLNSLEPIMSPEIVLHIKNKDKNKASSKLFIKKIELVYGDYLKGLSFIFESDGDEEILVKTRESENGLEAFPQKFEGYARYKIKDYSKEKFKQFEEISLKKISQEIYSFLNYNNSNNKEIHLRIPSLENAYSRMRFFPKERIFNYLGFLKIASINAGGWITEKKPGLVLNKIISNQKGSFLNDDFKKILVDHTKNVNYQYIDNIEKRNIDISLYIESSGNKNRINPAEKVDLNVVYQNKNFPINYIQKHNEIYEIFNKKFKSYFLKGESEKINEIEKTVDKTKTKNESLILDLNILNAMFCDIQEISKDNKNYKKYINEIFSAVESIKMELYELKTYYDLCYQKIYEPNSKGIFSFQLGFDTDKFFNKVPVIAPRFEKEIITDLDLLKNDAESIEQIKFKKEQIKGFIDYIYELIINLESIYLELYFETNAIKLNTLILDTKIDFKEQNINITALFDCINWLNNNSKTAYKEFDWTKDFKWTNYGKASLKKFIRQENSCLPFMPTNLFPLYLSSELIHLGPARSEGKRIYDINDINKLGKADCAYLLKLKNFKEYKERIDEILQKAKIANGIDINNLSNIVHDLKEIIIYPFDESEELDKGSEKGVNIVDTGYGISQILPIIINSILEGSNTILVQQPETHLHPRLQAEVGTIISKSLIKKGRYSVFGHQKNWIIETHSETLLFRLLKEMRDGNIKHSDLNVFYIDHDKEKGSSIKKMLISENGELISQWPNGFFSTDLEEIFD